MGRTANGISEALFRIRRLREPPNETKLSGWHTAVRTHSCASPLERVVRGRPLTVWTAAHLSTEPGGALCASCVSDPPTGIVTRLRAASKPQRWQNGEKIRAEPELPRNGCPPNPPAGSRLRRVASL